MTKQSPRIVVFSTLFPNPGQPNAGVFIRERMFRVGEKLPIVVVSPAPWFPFQGLIQKFKPHFRPKRPIYEVQQGVKVYYPRFFCIPGMFKFLDGFFMALGSYRLMQKLQKEFEFTIIDAHFTYPDGLAATTLGHWFKVPVSITMRGTEIPHAKNKKIRGLLIKALNKATQIFSVSSSLRNHAIELGVPEKKIKVVGNGVDTSKFYAVDKNDARKSIGIPIDAKVLITVGGLVERKGFHRVIEVLPKIKEKYADVHYLIVGGPCAEGDWTERLKTQVKELDLQDNVHFLGTKPPDELKIPLSAADVFVLSTRNEGWANVLLESLACGRPVIASDIGGNAEVICTPELGEIVAFDDPEKLFNAIMHALDKQWDSRKIIAYAEENSWDHRVEVLENAFIEIIES